MDSEKKVVLVTGSSSGFGELSVKSLAKKNHIVYASMRGVNGKNAEKAKELTDWASENDCILKIVELDVTKDESVNSAIKEIIDQHRTIDVVVNNAGVGVLGWQEHFTPDDMKKLFDVNVFGIQRVNRAVLPHMRKNNSGLLVQVTSILGRIVMPHYGPYNASKWAVEALSESYRVELSGFGIDVCTVEPGGYATAFIDKLMRPSDHKRKADYGELADLPEQSVKGFEEALASNPDQKPQDVADAITALVDTPAGKRAFRTVVDNIGMAPPVKEYNDHLEQVMTALFTNFGMADMLKLKTE